MHAQPPRTPPPMPQPTAVCQSWPVQLSTRVSPFIERLQEASQACSLKATEHSHPAKPLTAPRGPYFFYGTLMDPTLLGEILSLAQKPMLRPAKVVGYKVKLWGQYPALVDGRTDEAVKGRLYHVESLEHAERLGEYETKAYRSMPCRIFVNEGEQEQEIHGTTFKYVGNPLDINEGSFDLPSWLKGIGRLTDTVTIDTDGTLLKWKQG